MTVYHAIRQAVCAHCGRICRDYNGGGASVPPGHIVCHPNQPGRPDCYHLITVYGHEVMGCEPCSKEPYEPPSAQDNAEALTIGLYRLEALVKSIKRSSIDLDLRLAQYAQEAQ